MDSFTAGGSFEVPIITTNTLYWKAGSTHAQHRLTITGFTI